MTKRGAEAATGPPRTGLQPPQCFPHSSVGRESACNAGDTGSIPGSGRSPAEGTRLPTPAFWPGEFGVTDIRTGLSNLRLYRICHCFQVESSRVLRVLVCFHVGFPLPTPPTLPGRYLCHGRVQVVHDHKHDGCSRPRPAGVLIHWVGPARGPAARPVEGRAPGSSGPTSSQPGPWPCQCGRPAPASAEGAPTWSSH